MTLILRVDLDAQLGQKARAILRNLSKHIFVAF